MDPMKAKASNYDPALAVRCPTCGAKPGERCELATGQPRINPHRDRASDTQEKQLGGFRFPVLELLLHDPVAIARRIFKFFPV